MTDIHPNDLAEIASIFARGYLRYRDSLRRELPNGLDSTAEKSLHVPVVNGAENHQETAKATEGDGA